MASSSRPPVAVVVPFYGSAADAAALRAALAVVELGPDDELVVADNTEDGRFGGSEGRLRAVRAPLERSSYYARNVGVEATTAPWILFMDTDCRPLPDVVDRYFDPSPADRTGVVSGSVRSSGEPSLAASYATSRGHINPETYPGEKPTGVTANMLVRREAWEALGGFHEGLRSGADVEFCWRAIDHGWDVERRPDAAVEHEHPATVDEIRRKAARHSSGISWLMRRRPGSVRRLDPVRELPRSLAGGAAFPLMGQRQRGVFKLIDGLVVLSDLRGRTSSNGALPDATRRDPAPGPVAVRGEWPRQGDAAPQGAARVEVLRRPEVGAREPRRAVLTFVAEDESPAQALADLAWIVGERRLPRSALRHWQAAPAARRAVERGDTEIVVVAGDAEGERYGRAIAALAGLPLRTSR
jgi:GT2 family glycosyltransferase